MQTQSTSRRSSPPLGGPGSGVVAAGLKLARRLAGPMMSPALRRHDDSADIAQSVVMRAMRRIAAGGWRGRAPFLALIRRFVPWVVVDHARRRPPGSRSLGSAEGPRDDAAPDDLLVEREQLERVQSAIAALSPLQRKALRLSIDGLDTDRIAAEMGCSRTLVYKRISLARRRVAELLR